MKKDNVVKIIISFLIVVSPIGNIYRAGPLPLGLGDFGLCIAILLFTYTRTDGKILVKKKQCRFMPVFAAFFALSIFSIAIQATGMDVGDFISKWSRLIVYAIVMDIMLNSGIKMEYIKKMCATITIILSISIIVQEIAKLNGITIFPYFFQLPLNYSSTHVELIARLNTMNSLGIWRVSSIFPEPAHFSYYALMGLAILQFSNPFDCKRMWKIISLGIVTGAIFISGSANGFFVCVIIWGAWLIHKFREKITVQRLFVFAFIFLFFIIWFTNSQFFDSALYRLSTINTFSEGSTGGTRLLQGIFVYKQLSVFEMIFGVGFGNVSHYLFVHNIVTPFLTEVGNETMNAFSTVLVSGGVVGASIYFVMWVKLAFTRKTILSRVSMIIITILFLSAGLFYSSTIILYLSFALCKEN